MEEEDGEYEACLQSAATGTTQRNNRVLGKLVPPKSAADVQPLLQQTKVLLGKASTASSCLLVLLMLMSIVAYKHKLLRVLTTGAPTVMLCSETVVCFVIPDACQAYMTMLCRVADDQSKLFPGAGRSWFYS